MRRESKHFQPLVDGGRDLEETTTLRLSRPLTAYASYILDRKKKKKTNPKKQKHIQKRLTSALADVQDRLHVCAWPFHNGTVLRNMQESVLSISFFPFLRRKWIHASVG